MQKNIYNLYITLPHSDLEISKIKEGYFYIDDIGTQNEISIVIPNKTLDDIWQYKIDIANKSELTTFLFNYDKEYYISSFDKGMWTYPVKIKYI